MDTVVTELNRDWNTTSSIQYEVRINDARRRNLSITKGQAERLFKALFTETDLKTLWFCGKVRAAEYSKKLSDAYLAGVIDQDIYMIMMYLVQVNSHKEFTGFITERLVGKKRKEAFFELNERILVKLIEDK